MAYQSAPTMNAAMKTAQIMIAPRVSRGSESAVRIFNPVPSPPCDGYSYMAPWMGIVATAVNFTFLSRPHATSAPTGTEQS